MPNQSINKLSDDDISWSMVVFMQEHGGERMLRATASACKFISANPQFRLDGTSRAAWAKAEELVGQAAVHVGQPA